MKHPWKTEVPNILRADKSWRHNFRENERFFLVQKCVCVRTRAHARTHACAVLQTRSTHMLPGCALSFSGHRRSSVRDFRVNKLIQFSSYWVFGMPLGGVEPAKDTKEIEAIFFFCTDIASKCGLFVVFQDNVVTHTLRVVPHFTGPLEEACYPLKTKALPCQGRNFVKYIKIHRRARGTFY